MQRQALSSISPAYPGREGKLNLKYISSRAWFVCSFFGTSDIEGSDAKLGNHFSKIKHINHLFTRR